MIRSISIVVLFFLSLIFCAFTESADEVKEATINFSSDSYLKIKGKTNVNNFNCAFNIDAFSDAIKVNFKEYDSSIKFSKAILRLSNIEFDCGGKAINKDFNKLLNTEEHPQIVLNLKEITKIEEDVNSITATVEITICKISKTYKIPVSVDHEKGLYVSGLMPININDFNLKAPKKMLGMIKVSPRIQIEFSLKINEV